MRAGKVAADTVGHLVGREQPRRFDDRALAVDPLGLNGVEPGTLDRQTADEEAHAVPIVLDLAVVGPDPGADRLADMPGGVVPDHHPDRHALLLQLGVAPRQEGDGDGADRPAIHKAQPDALSLSWLPQQDPVTGQGFGIGIVFRDRLFDQAQGLAGVRPRVQRGLRQPAPPHLVGEAQHPVSMLLGQPDQAVACAFFRVYSGSGLVIQCLARCQPTPRRFNVWRLVSPLTRVGLSPSASLTAAARSKVQTLVGWPNSRGLRCSTARRRSACSGGKARRVRWGREEPLRSASSPTALKACRASSTVWSSQPNCWAIWGARAPRALASRIWQRRSTKASWERKPRSRLWRSASVNGRTKIGGRIPHSVPHSRSPILTVH